MLSVFLCPVSIPSEFTLLSNEYAVFLVSMLFQYPLNLHCSQTFVCCKLVHACFNTLWIYTALKQRVVDFHASMVSIPSEFTLLSNISIALPYFLRFQYPLNLHCSQTVPDGGGVGVSFNTLWIYTALKLHPLHVLLARGFNTLWIYTALKQPLD